MHTNLLTTTLSWKDLRVSSKTLRKITTVRKQLKESTQGNLLFHGPPGTGKTLTAALLGKEFNLPVVCVHLELIISKYVGETEKNLDILFKEASKQEMILFFDEADALFGKRTAVKDAHDNYANQEVSYLLQHIEAHSGIVIITTQIKGKTLKALKKQCTRSVKFSI